MTSGDIDQAQIEAFAGRLVGLFGGGAQTLLISIGHQTGLFDTLATLPPSTSQQIADAAGLQERYVREWLAGVVVGRIVDYAPADRTYALPPAHAALLTRAAGAKNMGPIAQLVALGASVERAVVDCFRRGGGVPYSAFPGFSELMAQLNGPIVDATLLQTTLPLAPGLVERLDAGIDVADVGCGSGHAVNVMAKAFPRSRFVGFDFSEESIIAARDEARELGLANARFEARDVATLDMRDAYDLITVFDAIHDQAQPKTVLKAIHRALRPGGTYLMADIAGSSNLEENLDNPLAPINYAVSLTHCMTVSLALGGEGLGNMWGEQKTIAYLEEAGFHDVLVKQIEGDILNNFYICAKT
jgi:ubiquinone/menaquinone biosynthesis C-methylase UbiE